MSLLKYFKIRYAVFIAVIAASFFLIHIVQAVSGEPGSEANPLVSQDYVDSKVNDMSAKINDLTASVNSLSQQLQSLQKLQASKYEIVAIKPGKQMITGDSTEIILRQGQAKVIGSSLGGLSDVTEGIDIAGGGNVPPNHLLIVPRDDGRGIVADQYSEKDVLVLVKGTYTIK